jgi:hypothetical protein
VVESFAAENGVAFMPKNGKFQEGKQVWKFGKSSCYLDQNVVFVYVTDGEWRPIGLEELVNIS